MKSYYFKCKTFLLHIISDSLELALKLIPDKYSHIGARVDNSVFIAEIDAPVDNDSDEEESLTFKTT